MNLNTQNIYPCQRMMEFGVESLTDRELLAVILRTGNSNSDVNEISGNLYKLICSSNKGLSGMLSLSMDKLKAIPGIGEVKASQLLAVAEISRRIRCDSAKDSLSFNSPSTVSEYYMERFRGKSKEFALVLFLSSSLELISEEVLSIGTKDMVLIDPKDIFFKAISVNASAIILLHNHPCGRVNPSEEDCKMTEYLRKYGDFLGIRFIDHLIMGDNRYYSFSEHEI